MASKIERLLSEIGRDTEYINKLNETPDEDWNPEEDLTYIKDYFVGQELPLKEKELKDKLHKEISGKESRELRDLIVKNSAGKVTREQAEKLNKAELVQTLINAVSTQGDHKDAYDKIKELSDLLESKEEELRLRLQEKENEIVQVKENLEISKILSSEISKSKIDDRFDIPLIQKLLLIDAQENGVKFKLVNGVIELVSATNEDMPIYKDGSKNTRLLFSDFVKAKVSKFEAKSLGGGLQNGSNNINIKGEDGMTEAQRKIKEELAKIRGAIK